MINYCDSGGHTSGASLINDRCRDVYTYVYSMVFINPFNTLLLMLHTPFTY